MTTNVNRVLAIGTLALSGFAFGACGGAHTATPVVTTTTTAVGQWSKADEAKAMTGFESVGATPQQAACMVDVVRPRFWSAAAFFIDNAKAGPDAMSAVDAAATVCGLYAARP